MFIDTYENNNDKNSENMNECVLRMDTFMFVGCILSH